MYDITLWFFISFLNRNILNTNIIYYYYNLYFNTFFVTLFDPMVLYKFLNYNFT